MSEGWLRGGGSERRVVKREGGSEQRVVKRWRQ